GASTAYQLGSAAKGGSVGGGLSGVGQAGASAAASPLRKAATDLGQRYQAGGRAAFEAMGGKVSGASPANDAGSASSEPDWAKAMRRRQSAAHGVQTAVHAVRAGDGGGAGSSVSVREGE
ncbi:MAG: P-type conjugative transfer protein TrbL, partial [Phenylobacterium sp.]